MQPATFPTCTNNNQDAVVLPAAPPADPAGVEILAENGAADLSALAFTTSDEQRELASLTISDIVALESDLRGITTGFGNLSVGNNNNNNNNRAASSSLSRLEEEIDKIPSTAKAAYLQAQVQNPSLVSEERKKMFLEYENNNAMQAASRLIDYWETRLKIFGPARCYLPMTLNGAMKGLVSDLVQRRLVALLPVKDTAGRAIILLQPGRRNFEEFSPEQENMLIWYTIEAALEDPDVRRKGIVFLANGKGTQRKHYNLYLIRLLVSVARCVPFHLRALHLCHPTAVQYYLIAPVERSFIGKFLRLRFKIHRGSDKEIVQILDTFRLPKDRVPTELGGSLCVDMERFVADRLARERTRIDPYQYVGTINDASSPPVVGELESATPTDAPIAKRLRIESRETPDKASAFATTASVPKKKRGRSKDKRKRKKGSGKTTDPRMARAIEIKTDDPKTSLRNALINGGFVFDSKDAAGVLVEVDRDGVSLAQRKNQLCRRIRLAKKEMANKQQQHEEQLPTEQKDIGSSQHVVVPRIISPGASSEACLEHSGNIPNDATSTATAVPASLAIERRDSFDEAIAELPSLNEL